MAEEKLNLTKGLRAWALKHDVTPTKFAEKTGYKYAYAWDLLRGKGEFTQEGLGRFTLVYGLEATAEVMQLAGDTNILKIEFTPPQAIKGKGSVQSVPMVMVTAVKTPEGIIS
jgi:hypothetical protein